MSNDMNIPETITIDDGRESFSIKNTQGEEIGVLRFRPSDPSIVNRYGKALTIINDALETAKRKAKEKHKSGSDDGDKISAISETLNELRPSLLEALDRLFEPNVSDAFFKDIDPFVVMDGHFYCEIVVKKIGEIISSRVGCEVKKLSERAAKYTHVYEARTGKHKNGRK